MQRPQKYHSPPLIDSETTVIVQNLVATVDFGEWTFIDEETSFASVHYNIVDVPVAGAFRSEAAVWKLGD